MGGGSAGNEGGGEGQEHKDVEIRIKGHVGLRM
jgi:hypothetical protein